MTLYKNVDICDLESILEKGILSLDESGNNNWDDDRRAENSTSCVYLFEPVEGKENAFPGYGVALLEVDVNGAEKAEFTDSDKHKGDYIEYTIAKVAPDQIKRIIIPEIFKNRLELPESVANLVEWCGFSATYYKRKYAYSCESEKVEADEKTLERFASTAELVYCGRSNFFRGTDDRGHLIDLYNINYIFN